MPAKEEEVKKYRDAAIGNAAIVEDQHSSLGLHSPFGFRIPNQSTTGGKPWGEKKKSDDSHVCKHTCTRRHVTWSFSLLLYRCFYLSSALQLAFRTTLRKHYLVLSTMPARSSSTSDTPVPSVDTIGTSAPTPIAPRVVLH